MSNEQLECYFCEKLFKSEDEPHFRLAMLKFEPKIGDVTVNPTEAFGMAVCNSKACRGSFANYMLENMLSDIDSLKILIEEL